MSLSFSDVIHIFNNIGFSNRRTALWLQSKLSTESQRTRKEWGKRGQRDKDRERERKKEWGREGKKEKETKRKKYFIVTKVFHYWGRIWGVQKMFLANINKLLT